MIQQIGPYRVEQEIGRGGMATVYRVTDPHGQKYALKLLHAAPSQDKRWGTRFRREFRLLSRLRHNHLIEVHDYGEDEHHAYYVMDYIDGTNLWKFYREELRGKSVHERLCWLIPLVSQIVSALDYIHHHRVIHKDLKPANILLQHNGESAYLADFGLARDMQDSAQYTHPGFMGTLGYSAPELVDRGRFDGRSDIYSLGVILYTLLADRRPIQVEGRNFQDLLIAIREEIPYPIQHLLPDLPREVGHIINKCIEKNPAERYRDTRELWRDLLPLIEHYNHIRSGLGQETLFDDDIPSIAHAEPLFDIHETTSAAPQAPMVMEAELLGRQQEMELCNHRFSSLGQQQQSSILLLYGVPGVGKSFLLDEIKQQFQRQSNHVYHTRIRPNAAPFGSLTEAIRPLLRNLPQSFRESNPAQLLAQYLPGLQDILPPPQIVAGPLTQPVLQLTNLLLPFMLQYTPQSQLVWLLDDLHLADPTSKRVLSHLMSTLLTHNTFGFMLVASVGYQAEDNIPPFPIAEHTQLTHHYLSPLSEEEESLFVTRLLGRTPNPQELQQIRSVTRGLPMRTVEVAHQGTLLAQSPFQAMESTNANMVIQPDDILSSVSTAIHELSSFQDALGLTRPGTDAEQAAASTPVVTPNFAQTAVTPSEIETAPYTEPPKQTATPLFVEEAAEPGESTMLQPSLSDLSASEALDMLSRSIENESTIPAPLRRRDLLPSPDEALAPETPPHKEDLFREDAPSSTTAAATFYPEKTVMMQSLPSNLWASFAVVDPAPAPPAPLSGTDKELDEESIQELLSSDELVEETSWQEHEPGESTMLQEDLSIGAISLAKARPTPPKAANLGATLLDDNVVDGNQTMLAEPFVPKLKATLVDPEPTPEAPTGQNDLLQFTESSEELVLVPLIQRRLDMLDTTQRQQLALTSFLAEEFTYDELRESLQSTPEVALDLLNTLLSMRLLKVEVIDEEEYYSHLHPVMRQVLLSEIPPDRRAECALRAAQAMANCRETYHKQNNASFMAMRFTDGADPAQAFHWQLHGIMHTLQMHHTAELKESLKQLQQILTFWIERGSKLKLLQVIPRLFDPETQNISLLSQAGQQLLLVGVLHIFEAKDTVAAQSKKARDLLKQLLAMTPGTASPAFKMTLQHLSPLLQFARLRIRKKK